MPAEHLMEFCIRRLTKADEPFLWEMLYQALFVPPGQQPFPRDIVRNTEISRYVDGWGRDDDFGVVAFHPQTLELIGAAWVRLLTGEDRGYGWINDQTPELTIAVLPEYRGNGLGQRLLAQLLELVRASYDSVSLSVSIENPARRLYERAGFQTVARDKHSLTMKKDLKNSVGATD
ncbi:MAG: GNAT family N-acetyltransferase [Acidobacteriota bacterium]